MASLNKVLLIGRLGRDPELRFTATNTAVTNFGIATEDRYKNKKTDQWETETEWHKIVVWGKQAERCDKFLRKGSLVFVEGRLKTREWEDKSGSKRYTTEIVAQHVEFLKDWGNEGGGSGGGSGRQQTVGGSSDDDGGFDQSFSDDEIPF
jgi:single-strand DNA-binding protein